MENKEFKHSDKDKEINVILNDICANNALDISELSDNDKRGLIILMDTKYGIVTPNIQNSIFPTEKGSRIHNNGGWLKNIELQYKKDIYDFKTSKWKFKTFWIWFFLGLFGGLYSVYDIIVCVVSTITNNQ